MIKLGSMKSDVVMVLMAGILAGGVIGCSNGTDALRHELLFTPEGGERVRPSNDLYRRLVDADDDVRRRLIRRLTEIISRDGGYARVAAVCGLHFFLVEHPEYYNATIVEAVANAAIRIAPQDEEVWLPVEQLLDANHALPRRVAKRLDVYPAIQGESVPLDLPQLGNNVPRGWRAKTGIVLLDNEPVASHVGLYDVINGETHIPSISIDLRQCFQNVESNVLMADRLVGDHEIVTILTVIGPDGTEVCLSKRLILHLRPLRAFTHRPAWQRYLVNRGTPGTTAVQNGAFASEVQR